MEPSDSATIRVKKTSRATINEFCARCHCDVIDFMEQLTTELQKQLDLMEPNKRLLYMVDFYNRDNHPKTIIRLSDALMSSLEEMPSAVQSKVMESFGYVRDPKTGHIVDTTEKQQEPHPPEEKKE